MAVNPTIVKIESEMFTPALQEAMKQAQGAGHTISDAVMAATNAHLNMLVEVVGVDSARSLLERQAGFLNAQQSKKG